MTEKAKSYSQKSASPIKSQYIEVITGHSPLKFSELAEPSESSEQMLDLDVLEGAVTLSSMDAQNRNIQFHDVQYQGMEIQGVPVSSFPQPQDARGMQNSAIDATPAPIMDETMLDFDDSSLAEFLKDVMMPASPTNTFAAPNSLEFVPQHYPGRDVFNFGFESSLDFTDMDFGWISSQNSRQPAHWNYNQPPPDHDHERLNRGQETPDVSSGITAGAEAFQKSIWRWKPVQQEHAFAEQINLSLPYKDMQHYLESRLAPDVLDQRLEQNSRDKILAMLLSTCEPSNVSRVVTSFPSADLLDSLMHLFFRSELSRTDSWIHIPTFRPQNQRPELNGIVVAAGAVLSSVPTVRKLGFAIQEAVRLAIPQIV
jgi:hypothetical protein